MVRPGYKQTEVGEIPEDWKEIVLGEHVVKVGSGITPKGGATVYKDAGRPFVRSQNVGWGDLRLSDLSYIDEETHQKFPATEIHSGDVLLNITGASIGRCSIANDFLAGGNVNQHVCIIRTNKELDQKYVSYVLLSSIGQKQIDSFQAGGNREGLNFGQIRSFILPKPKEIKEQSNIAKALSDVDELIASLEKLIAKKRDIKTATMQQLLTGKKRLPGFGEGKGYKQTELGEIPEDWDLLELNSISTMHGRIGWQGLKQEEFTFNDSQPFLITGMNFKDGKIRWNEVYHIPDDRYELDRNIQLRDGDVLMTKDGTIGKILYVENIPYPHKASLNSHLLVFRPKEKRYFPKYLYYLLKSKFFLDFVDLNKSGSTFFGITQEAIGKFSVLLPLFEEQKAIAKVLADIDDDIETLILRLSKTKAIKQGMMQELLTGRTRLVDVAETKKTKAA